MRMFDKIGEAVAAAVIIGGVIWIPNLFAMCADMKAPTWRYVETVGRDSFVEDYGLTREDCFARMFGDKVHADATSRGCETEGGR